MALQLQAPIKASHSSPLAPTGNAGLRLNSNRFALKSSFFSSSVCLFVPSSFTPSHATAPKFSMHIASKQAYICRDCEYIYNERTLFEKLSNTYFCPVCGAPKRRFRSYEPAVTKNANEMDVRKARKAQLKIDEAIRWALPTAIVVGVAALAGLYFYLNSSF